MLGRSYPSPRHPVTRSESIIRAVIWTAFGIGAFMIILTLLGTSASLVTR